MLSLEFELIDRFYWSLHDIDETDIESLIPFVFELPRLQAKQKGTRERGRALYADEATWL